MWKTAIRFFRISCCSPGIVLANSLFRKKPGIGIR